MDDVIGCSAQSDASRPGGLSRSWTMEGLGWDGAEVENYVYLKKSKEFLCHDEN